MKKHRLLSALAAACLMLTLSPAAGAQFDPSTRTVIAVLLGEEEVPPRETPAIGLAVFRLSPDGNQIRFRLLVANIENVVGAHIHEGPPGVNGPIIVDLFGALPGGGPVKGILSQGVINRSTNFRTGYSFDRLLALARSGNTYVNVHTNDGIPPADTGPGDFPGGEIRGQVRPFVKES